MNQDDLMPFLSSLVAINKQPAIGKWDNLSELSKMELKLNPKLSMPEEVSAKCFDNI